VLTVDPEINVHRVRSRVEEGGHDVPIEKIVERYKRALELVKDVVSVSDICHVYDNSSMSPFRIFKKRKDECFYNECFDWNYEDIKALTGVSHMNLKKLNY
jgi:predicted ABC-type ATPase